MQSISFNTPSSTQVPRGSGVSDSPVQAKEEVRGCDFTITVRKKTVAVYVAPKEKRVVSSEFVVTEKQGQCEYKVDTIQAGNYSLSELANDKDLKTINGDLTAEMDIQSVASGKVSAKATGKYGNTGDKSTQQSAKSMHDLVRLTAYGNPSCMPSCVSQPSYLSGYLKITLEPRPSFPQSTPSNPVGPVAGPPQSAFDKPTVPVVDKIDSPLPNVPSGANDASPSNPVGPAVGASAFDKPTAPVVDKIDSPLPNVPSGANDASPSNPVGPIAGPAVSPPPIATPLPESPPKPVVKKPTPKMSDLVKQKLANPKRSMTVDESIACLQNCIDLGEVAVAKAQGQSIIVFIGNTGAGKSTAVNYLAGCEMEVVNKRDIAGLSGRGQVIRVKAESEKSALMAIGHEGISKTFVPDIGDDGVRVYCDAPGFLDNRGEEINIGNAVNIKQVLGAAKTVRVIILMNADANVLRDARGRGFRELVQLTTDLFGDEVVLAAHKDGILLMATQLDTSKDDLAGVIGDFTDHIKDNPSETLSILKDRVVIADPANRVSGEDGWLSRADMLKRIDDLAPIETPSDIFKTVLTRDDEKRLREIADELTKRIDSTIETGNYAGTQKNLGLLGTLDCIDNAYVMRLVQGGKDRVKDLFSKMKDQVMLSVLQTNFSQAKSTCQQLEAGVQVLGEIPGLAVIHDYPKQARGFIAHGEKKEAEQQQLKADMATMKDQYETIHRQLQLVHESKQEAEAERKRTLEKLALLEKQQVEREAVLKSERDQELAKLRQEISQANAQEKQKLERELLDRQKAYDDLATRERAEKEAQSVVLKEKEQELARLAAQKAKDEAEFAVKLEQAKAEAVKLVKTVEQKKHKTVDEVRGLLKSWGASDNYIAQNFIGDDDWGQIFGSEFRDGQAVPSELIDFLQQASVFDPSKKVWQDHMVCWIPAGISLNRFEDELFGKIGAGYHKDHAKLRYFGDKDKSDKKADAIMSGRTERGGWCTMYVGDVTKDSGVIPNSRDKRWDSQEKVFNDACGGQGYEIGSVRYIGVAVLMRYIKTGDKILSDNITGRPWTWARSPEKWATGYISGRHGGVGAFDTDGLRIYDCDYVRAHIGVAAARWFSGPLTL